MTVDEPFWSRVQDKAFENALATYPEDSSDWWEKIAANVPGKTLEEIKHHYELLVDDVNNIESGCVPLPSYNSSSEGSSSHAGDGGTCKKGGHGGHYNSESNHGCKARSDQERRKGIAWTEDEHRLFILGLDKYGKGDWRSISRNFVVTRTPTQLASHAQIYFIRLNSMNKDRRRSSIHDITSVGNSDISAPQGPITGQANGSCWSGICKIIQTTLSTSSRTTRGWNAWRTKYRTTNRPPRICSWHPSESSCPSTDGIWCQSTRSWSGCSWCTDEHGSHDVSRATYICS